MSTRRPNFNDPQDWDEGSGSRSKVFSEGAARLRLVELTPAARHPEWCRTGHSGCVVEGSLEIEFDSEVVRFDPGEGILIPPGEDHRHRPRALTERVRLALVDHPAHPPPSPKSVVQAWVRAFNVAAPDSLAALYAPDAVNHQIAESPIEGREAIRKMFEREFAAAKMTCIVENLFEDGDWAVLEWKDPLGLRGCGFFHIVDGQIQFQRGYWDKLSFLRQHGLPIPSE